MKITRLETLCLSRMHEPERQWITTRYRTIKSDCAIVVLHTDAGLVGIGEASAYGWPLMIRGWVNWLAPELIGQDPCKVHSTLHPNGRSTAHDAAVAGIDCALWDLRAKIEGVRVSELLCDRPLERVRLYASSGCRYDWRDHPEQLIEEALEYVALGMTAFKFRIGTEWSWDGVTVDRFLGLVRELTQEVNGRMELMLDANCRLTEDQAMEVALELDRLGFTWFEEPMPRENIKGYARLCTAVDLPITGGETFATLEQFRPYLEQKALDIVQQDASVCGITEATRIAEVARRHGVDWCPHSWLNGLMVTENAHCVAALPNPRFQELCMIHGPLQWAILANPPAIEDGYLVLPDRPGLGVTLAEDLEARFPYIEGSYATQVQR
jgi:L-alanine-DL-glutamate epimerase-like enolase superfamily enzyme